MVVSEINDHLQYWITIYIFKQNFTVVNRIFRVLNDFFVLRRSITFNNMLYQLMILILIIL